MSDHTAKRQLSRGYGDAMTRAFEIVLTPLIFGGLGWLLDRALGTSPGFMLGLGAFAVVGTFVKMWIVYDQDMQREERAIDHRGRSAMTVSSSPGVEAAEPQGSPS